MLTERVEKGRDFFIAKKFEVRVSDSTYTILKEKSVHNEVTMAYIVRCALKYYFLKKGWFKNESH